MTYMGLVPSEYSSGSKRRQGSITKAGNSRLRKLLLMQIEREEESASGNGKLNYP